MIACVRARTKKPVIVKLTPNTADVAGCAAAAEAAGADAVSLINTLRAMAFAPARANSHASAWLGGGTGGLSGPAVRTVALAQVCAVAERVAVPVVGMGGVETAAHARDMLDAGATLVAVGTASFRDPLAAARIARGLAGA
jgi:dihydroorotate dehydrogenase (NAD+) catalytic subunit